MGDTKLERFLPKNQHTQRKSLNFENWVNGVVSKIGRHFTKQSDSKIAYQLYPSLIVKKLKIELSPRALQRFF